MKMSDKKRRLKIPYELMLLGDESKKLAETLEFWDGYDIVKKMIIENAERNLLWYRFGIVSVSESELIIKNNKPLTKE